MTEKPEVVVIGAGPAGLTAGWELVKRDVPVTIIEGDSVVGGISRTAQRDGWRFDIGGHRFFTKVPEVEKLWHEILPDEDFLMRPRSSRIYYNGKFFDYPLKPANALGNLGVVEAARCIASYAAARVRPPKDQSNYENWLVARFGWRLYRTFFKTYTEKVWGVPVNEMPSDWAAQRIKSLSMFNAIVNAVLPKKNQKDITSLIEEFQYPKYGPGMMWETATDKIVKQGGRVVFEEKVRKIHHENGRATGLTTEVIGGYGPGAGAPESSRTDLGSEYQYTGDEFISSMSFSSLVKVMDPPAPAHVLAAANALKYRDFLTVALVVPESAGFPDNWIYIHAPTVKVGRIQNFASWSPYLVKDGKTCLGLEYFVFEGDDTWSSSDEDLIALGTRELVELGLIRASQVETGYVVRMPKAYPYYDTEYKKNVDIIRAWLAENTPNVHPVGRNGMHRYNNQDHSMLTALLTVENIVDGTHHDVWEVNVDEDYHEEVSSPKR
ncbi:NAD(P)/FAD-dependent oxidoreductase [Frankia sp. AgPm24]|uniref:NAD(P)/FAD-dependent oxidoreductase n=1 Tax=Frankia umida TaxID=573489 RepID=A0ABT0K259_9ACTN|nr:MULTISPECIES: NAD(P)/FAD-dependent oxidoreductase [Frankia]MCK9877572.1 NAD(P)/FAD-dependent oxidoreductase [Frankia umida]MCK9925163.1 NAD(P)/FAD-dependent oxidoreductase [Frankia sp. AgPm24]